MKWIYDDGGRSNYYKAKNVRDCVCRAISIANNKDYKEIYRELTRLNYGKTPRNGVSESIYKKLLENLGWKCVECENENVYLKTEDIPAGIVICKISRHLVAVKNKTIYDTWDCSKAIKGKCKGEYDKVKIIKYWVKVV